MSPKDEDRSPSPETDDEGLSLDELESQSGTPLPDREAMSLISANVDIPAEPAIAADVLAGDLDDYEDEDGSEKEEAEDGSEEDEA